MGPAELIKSNLDYIDQLRLAMQNDSTLESAARMPTIYKKINEIASNILLLSKDDKTNIKGSLDSVIAHYDAIIAASSRLAEFNIDSTSSSLKELKHKLE